MVNLIAADISVESKTLAKEQGIEKQVLENDRKVENTIKPYEQVCTLKETTKVTIFNKKNYQVTISIRTFSK